MAMQVLQCHLVEICLGTVLSLTKKTWTGKILTSLFKLHYHGSKNVSWQKNKKGTGIARTSPIFMSVPYTHTCLSVDLL